MTTMPAEVPDIDTLQAAFRDVMATVCTPVSVVTGMNHDRPHGTTVSAFASPSMDPPMVLISLDRGSDLLAIVRETGLFGLNVLGSEQSGLATAFAHKGPDRFAGMSWELRLGVPRIQGVGGFLACCAAQLVEGGDHIVVLGSVLGADAADSRPLLYHSRVFGTHSPLTGTPA